MKYSYNRLIWEGFYMQRGLHESNFLNFSGAFSVRVKAITISSSSLHKILTSLIVQNFCM